MTRLFQWLDEAFSFLVPLCYLAALVGGSVAYFGGYVPNPVVVVGTAVGIAAEVHAWLQQRRVRASYGAMARMSVKDPRRAILERQFRLQGAILLALVAFSMWNSNLFLASFWHPAASTVPVWVQFMVRGSVIPGFFLLTGFLTPLSEDPVHYLNRVAVRDLRGLLRAHRKDVKQRIKQVRKLHGDLTPVVVAYAVDLGEVDVARRMRLINEGIAEAESAVGMEGTYAPYAASVPEVGYFPPTGPGSPSASPLPIIPGPDSELLYGGGQARYNAPAPMSSFRNKKQRTAAEARSDAEFSIRTLLSQNPSMSRAELMRRGHIAMADVDHWRPKILEEMGIETRSSRQRGKRRGKMAR